jgi:hypothetical protein
MTMRSAFFILATSLVLVASLASAFVTPAGRTISTRRISLWAGEAEEVGDDPFQNYKIGDPLQGLAINDAEVGEGEMAAVGNVITVTYTGRLLATGKVFDQGDGFSLKLGAGKAIQGWEQGLLVCVNFVFNSFLLAYNGFISIGQILILLLTFFAVHIFMSHFKNRVFGRVANESFVFLRNSHTVKREQETSFPQTLTLNLTFG